ncbi:putative nuclear DNA-binding protein [Neospora caninum Liverpool]|uniref:Nuclear nucleic acid-binding protein C1D n=1 Tax=Neospora caninum (strain Liverpool) TaxID=572307 RepID=F0V943_NEOCL|nr:putative nuclear DNA-binding protein [Neospora caninum Liverpool]CBZ50268.1 putative nuclear DNA-binding protein [Neospora caninum Liverpool]CEL64872.1 TPA: nuclear DNA-binding protein, putative [Neospora caninum Liverpool]|eukprot:XP_003880302.1 putative nuclear DNA-binding protein [Neospora caninum Liverpool]
MASKDFCSVLSEYCRELGSVRTLLETFKAIRTAEDGEEQPFEKLTALEVAQFHLALAFASSSLFFAYLKTQGYDVKAHPVSQDLLRVRQYMRKAASVIENGNPPKRSTVVDTAAAKRVVAFHTGSRAQSATSSSPGKSGGPPTASGSPGKAETSERKRRLPAGSPEREAHNSSGHEASPCARGGPRSPAARAPKDAEDTPCKEAAASISPSSLGCSAAERRQTDAKEGWEGGKNTKRSKTELERKGSSRKEWQGDARTRRKKP